MQNSQSTKASGFVGKIRGALKSSRGIKIQDSSGKKRTNQGKFLDTEDEEYEDDFEPHQDSEEEDGQDVCSMILN